MTSDAVVAAKRHLDNAGVCLQLGNAALAQVLQMVTKELPGHLPGQPLEGPRPELPSEGALNVLSGAAAAEALLQEVEPALKAAIAALRQLIATTRAALLTALPGGESSSPAAHPLPR